MVMGTGMIISLLSDLAFPPVEGGGRGVQGRGRRRRPGPSFPHMSDWTMSREEQYGGDDEKGQ